MDSNKYKSEFTNCSKLVRAAKGHKEKAVASRIKDNTSLKYLVNKGCANTDIGLLIHEHVNNNAKKAKNIQKYICLCSGRRGKLYILI